MPEQRFPVWLIAGCSTGFGHALARLVLDRGWRAVVTARDAPRLDALVRGAERRALALALDLADARQISAVAEAARERFGRVDVLVNNAGYGYESTVEEGEDAEIRAQVEANVFGLFAVTRAVRPMMRGPRSGNVINVTSVAGLLGLPGSGYYAASKHAVEGWSDALRAEVGPLGIGVTCVEPGPFRADRAGRPLKQTPNRIADYADTAGKRLEGTRAISGRQPGDPVRAGEAMIALTERADPSRHLVLGAFGDEAVSGALQARIGEIRGLRETSLSADFPKN